MGIGRDYATIEIRSDPVILTLSPGESKYLDLSGNGINDFVVKLLSITYKPYNNQGTNAEFEFSEIEEIEPITIGAGAGEGEEPQDEETQGSSSPLTGGVIGALGTGGTIIVVIVFAVAIVFLIVFLRKNRLSKKKK